jgi:cell shape-determining protein MreD
MRVYPVWQQSFGVAVLLALDTLTQALVRFFLDEDPFPIGRWLTPFASMILWPVVVVVLSPRSKLRRYG